VVTPTCPVARSRSCGAFFRDQKKRGSPLRALPGSTIRLAGWTRERRRAAHRAFGVTRRPLVQSRYPVVSSAPSRGDVVERRQAIAVVLGARWANGQSGLRLVERRSAAASAVATRRRKARLGELARARRGGRSGVGVPAFRGEHAGRVVAVATPSWRRASTSAPRFSAADPHRPPCRRSLGTRCTSVGRRVCTRHQPWSLVSSTARGTSRQPRLRGSRIGGTRSPVATLGVELQPKPARSGDRSRYDGGGSTTSPKTSVPEGNRREAGASNR